MIKDGKGGARTLTGLAFEEKSDFLTLLGQSPDYEVRRNKSKAGSEVLHKGKLVARTFKKHDFYKFLAEFGVDYSKIISKKLLPDDALYVMDKKTVFIIEVKFQQVAGSVDEKLQTCDFKKKQYLKLVQGLGMRIEYVYILNDWFQNPAYKDVLDYINSVGCHYEFQTLPFALVGLPEG